MGMGDYLGLERPTDEDYRRCKELESTVNCSQLELDFNFYPKYNPKYNPLKHIHDVPNENPRIDFMYK
jgi:hypothetical protein